MFDVTVTRRIDGVQFRILSQAQSHDGPVMLARLDDSLDRMEIPGRTFARDFYDVRNGFPMCERCRGDMKCRGVSGGAIARWSCASCDVGGDVVGIEDFARVINLARIVYQVEVDGVSGSLIDIDCLRVDVCPPGVQGLADPGEGDATPRPTPDTWRITIGENDDGDLARGEGATLSAAVEDLRRVVEARAEAVRDAMRAAGAPGVRRP